MIRSTKRQKAQRLNAALALLQRGVTPAEAAATLASEHDLSLRQAYRYLAEADVIGHRVALVEPSRAITLKLPENVIRDLHAYAAVSRLSLGEIVARALSAFLAKMRRHG
jgi:predicted DNA-binding transcriptional regulator YafY